MYRSSLFLVAFASFTSSNDVTFAHKMDTTFLAALIDRHSKTGAETEHVTFA